VGEVEKMKEVWKWWPKSNSLNPRRLHVYIGEGSARMLRDRCIKSLSSLHWFLKMDHTARMPFFVAANDSCWSHGSSVGVKAQFGIQFLSILARIF
jgi:hypothetical protein